MLTRIGLGGVGRTYGTISDKTEAIVTAGLSVKKYIITVMDKAISIIVKDKTNEIKI